MNWKDEILKNHKGQTGFFKTLETMERFNELIGEYFKIKDDLLEYTEDHHDSMLFDIDGYHETMGEAIDDDDQEYMIQITDELETQVKAFRLILKGLVMVNYHYA
tara:strand:+ start:327 stop:641 length:315 start_codon:yes stop_codon:yes gene_type:complete